MAFNEMNLQYWDALENLQSGQLEVVIVSCEGNLYWPQIHLAQSNMGWAPPSSLPFLLLSLPAHKPISKGFWPIQPCRKLDL